MRRGIPTAIGLLTLFETPAASADEPGWAREALGLQYELASDVELRLRLDALPRPEEVEAADAAVGGDDYELLFTIAPELREAAEAAAAVSWLGDVRAGRGLVLLDADGRPVEGLRGYEHE